MDGRQPVICMDCWTCGGTVSAPLAHAGKTLPCPHCSSSLDIPKLTPGEQWATPAQPIPPAPGYQAAQAPFRRGEVPPGQVHGAQPFPPGQAPVEPWPTPARPRRPGRVRNMVGYFIGLGGALFLILGALLPLVDLGGAGVSLAQILSLPGEMRIEGFIYLVWFILLATMAAALYRYPESRGASLWGLALLLVVIVADRLTALSVAGTLAEAPVSARAIVSVLGSGFYVSVFALLLVVGAAFTSIGASVRGWEFVGAYAIVGGILIAGYSTDWFGIARERLVVKSVVQRSDGRGAPLAAVTITIANSGSRPAYFQGMLGRIGHGGGSSYAMALERKDPSSGRWTDASLLLGFHASGIGRLAPGKSRSIGLRLAPAYDLSVPGSELITPMPKTMAGDYQVVLHRPDIPSRRVSSGFSVRGSPHPDIPAARSCAEGEEAERAAVAAGSPEERLRLLENAEASYKGVGNASFRYRSKAYAAQRRVSGLLRVAREMARERKREQELARANQLLGEKRYKEAISAYKHVQSAYPRTTQARAAWTNEQKACVLMGHGYTRAKLAQVWKMAAARDYVGALYAIRALERDPELTSLHAESQRSARKAYESLRNGVNIDLNKLTCGARAKLYEDFRKKYNGPDAAQVKLECRRVAEGLLRRKGEAEALLRQMKSSMFGDSRWRQACRHILDRYADTKVAAELRGQGIRRKLEYYEKKARKMRRRRHR